MRENIISVIKEVVRWRAPEVATKTRARERDRDREGAARGNGGRNP